MHPTNRFAPRRGFTLVELVIVLTIAGILAAVGLPRFRTGRDASNMRSAESQITSVLATARASAVRRARPAELRVSGSQLVVVSGIDTIVRPVRLDQNFGVTLAAAPAVIRFDPRGLASLDNSVRFVFARAARRDTVCVTRLGAVMREGCL